MRYEARKSNGVWHVFDTFEYKAIAKHPANHRHIAQEAVDAMNGLVLAFIA